MKNTLHIDFKTINSVEELKSLQESVNNTFAEVLKEMTVKEKGSELANKSFGYIKESLENLSESLYGTTKGKKLINRYISTIKESKNLSTLHTIYENLRKTGADSDVDYFVTNLIKNKVDNKTVREDVKKLGKVLEEAYCYLGESANALLPTENEKLDSAIEFVVENRESHKNLSEFSAAIKVLREDIGKRESSISFSKSKNIDDVANKLVKEFNEKYSDLLTIEEQNLVAEIGKSNNPEEVFEKYKDICESKIESKKLEFENAGDTESAKKVTSIAEQIKNKKYSVETIVEDINNIFEITKLFE